MQPSTVIVFAADERALGCCAAPLGVCGVSGARGAADGGEDGLGDGVCGGACAASDTQSSVARELARNILLMLASSSRDGTNAGGASKLNATVTSAFRSRSTERRVHSAQVVFAQHDPATNFLRASRADR